MITCFIYFHSWAGTLKVFGEIIKINKKSYQIKLLQDTIKDKKGKILNRVPKYAVKIVCGSY